VRKASVRRRLRNDAQGQCVQAAAFLRKKSAAAEKAKESDAFSF
jgi:hypothetical protein